jgi:hypothetical protein
MTMFKPTNQSWSWIYVLTGCTMVMLAHHAGIPTDIGSGIIGAGLQAFTSITKSEDGRASPTTV